MMPDLPVHNVIVTGAIGSGKSTVVRSVMARLGWREPSGFFTHWKGAERPAPELFIEPWTGGAQVMARQLPDRPGPDGVPYALDVDSFTRTALAGLKPERGAVVVDELGVLELGAQTFCTEFAGIFNGPGPVLVVIQERALSRWLALLDPGRNAPVFTVTSANRNGLPADIARVFQ